MDPDLSQAKQLLPWELAFAEWYAKLPRNAQMYEQVEAANRFWQKTLDPNAPIEHEITEKDLVSLRSRKAFRNHVKIVRAGGYKAARRLLKQYAPDGVAAHFRGLQLAEAANDYNVIPKYTVPIMREVSQAAKSGQAVAAVQINITSKQQDLIEAKKLPSVQVEEMECEVVEE